MRPELFRGFIILHKAKTNTFKNKPKNILNMKTRSYLSAMLAMSVFAITGCDTEETKEPVQLAAPAPAVSEVTESTATITWEGVENAAGYSYALEGSEEATTAELSVTLEGLTPSQTYTFKIKALSSDENNFTDSEWASVQFTLSEAKPTKYTVYPLDPFYVLNELGEMLVTSYVSNISPSGQYAVGYDNQFGNPTSFVWDRSTGEYTILKSGSYAGCVARDVNDNGIIVGSVVDDSQTEYPAYMDFKNSGEWTLLPTNGGENIMSPSFAAAISNDGKIGGQIMAELNDGTKRAVPCTWTNYQLDQNIFDIPEDSDESCMYGAFIYSMSEDSRVLAGWQDWGIGSRSPAIWVDGKLTRIYGEAPIIDEEGYIYEGIAWTVNSKGTKAAGYFNDGMTMKGFIYDISTGAKEEMEYAGVAFDGNDRLYLTGSMGFGAYYYENGEVKDLSTIWEGLECTFANEVNEEVGTDGMLNAVYSVSEDGKVIGGSFMYQAFDSSLQYPCIIVIE